MSPSKFRMPAEWEPHRATWLAWPERPSDWAGKFATIPWTMAEIIRHLATHERVALLVRNAQKELPARRVLKRAGVDLSAIEFYRVATNRSWLRDSGPIFVRAEKRLLAMDFGFNGWARYRDWDLDDRVPKTVASLRGVQLATPLFQGRRVVLEGGAMDVDGKGTLLTSEECLLGKTQVRNRGFTRESYEQIFRDYLGIKRVIWLGKGIVGDDTHGHVDDMVRFVRPGVVVACKEPNREDANHRVLTDNQRRLKDAGLQVVDLPMPEPLYFSGRRLPASYANFYVANGIVIVPTFNSHIDRVALDILERCFPTREVVGIHALDLLWGLGTLHCLTQQEPISL